MDNRWGEINAIWKSDPDRQLAAKKRKWSARERGFPGGKYGKASKGRSLSPEELEKRARELGATLK